MNTPKVVESTHASEPGNTLGSVKAVKANEESEMFIRNPAKDATPPAVPSGRYAEVLFAR